MAMIYFGFLIVLQILKVNNKGVWNKQKYIVWAKLNDQPIEAKFDSGKSKTWVRVEGEKL